MSRSHIKKYGPVFFIALVYFWIVFKLDRWNEEKLSDKPIYWDVISYYAYLPAFFIHGDLRFEFLDKPNPDTAFINLYWLTTLENGRKLIKSTMAWAMLNLPVFFAAHAAAGIWGYPQDGFSKPYQMMVSVNAAIFSLAGIGLLYLILLKYFSWRTSVATLFAVAFGTNLLAYSLFERPMSHPFSFFLIALFLYLTILWHENQRKHYMYLLGAVFGLIALMRPTNSVIILLFLLYGMHKNDFFANRLAMLRMHWKSILAAGFIAFLVILPQLFYWKAATGQWLFNSYVGERFFFNRPMIAEFLFSYRKGWFIYTPVMLLAMAGFFIKREALNGILPQSLIIVLITIGLNSCWWCWWFGGSFGSRPMVDYYALCAMPLAILVEKIMSSHYMVRLIGALALVFLVFVNVFQSYQYLATIIHWDSMTAEAYWHVFLKMQYPENYDKLLSHPDYDAAIVGKVVK